MSITTKKLIAFSIICYLALVTASFAVSSHQSKTKIWLNQNARFAALKILRNTSPTDGEPGSIIAATTRFQPNYHYHWVRDAALAIESLIGFYESSNDQDLKKQIYQQIFNYLNFTALIQNVGTQSGLGEPKFNVNGSAFNGAWGRPQNDGPALRALSLIHWANILIANNKVEIVRNKMYSSALPAKSPIKKDLEYISHHWKQPSFDLWEEVKGSHFYNLMVTRRALLEGATLAKYFKDDGAATWYFQQAKEIEHELQLFWDAKKNYFISTINQTGGLTYKVTNLDISVILGLLHGDMHDGFIPWDDKRVVATLNNIIRSFSRMYVINRIAEIPGFAIGRYPEDRYAGNNFDGGNPWPLCTLAVAEALYRYAAVLTEKGKIKLAKRISHKADQFVERVRYHAHKNGSLDEQIDKDSGYMASATDLTWNYAALLTTRHSTMQNL